MLEILQASQFSNSSFYHEAKKDVFTVTRPILSKIPQP